MMWPHSLSESEIGIRVRVAFDAYELCSLYAMSGGGHFYLDKLTVYVRAVPCRSANCWSS